MPTVRSHPQVVHLSNVPDIQLEQIPVAGATPDITTIISVALGLNGESMAVLELFREDRERLADDWFSCLEDRCLNFIAAT